MSRRKPLAQLAFNFEGEPEKPPCNAVVTAPEAPPLTPRDYPPWHPGYVKWFNQLGAYEQTREQIRLDKIALLDTQYQWMKELLENRIRRNQEWIDKEDSVPF